MRETTKDRRQVKQGARLALCLWAGVICVTMLCGEVLGNKIDDVTVEPHYKETSSALDCGQAVCQCKYWAYVTWDVDPGSDQDSFTVEIWQPGAPSGSSSNDYYPPTGTMIGANSVGPTPWHKKVPITNSAALTPGEHTIRAWVAGDDISSPGKWGHSAACTVYIAEVNDIDVGVNEACVNSDVNFVADPNPPGKTVRCLEWQKGYKADSSSSWTWDPVEGTGVLQTLNTSTPGIYRYQARNCKDYGCTACDWVQSDDVNVVDVKVVVKEGSSDEGPLYVSVGDSCDLEAKIEPSGMSFPSGQPTWEIISYPGGSSPSVSPQSDSNTTTLSGLTVPGEYVVNAKCCPTCDGDSITVIALQVDLDIDGVAEEDEETTGGVVVRDYNDNNAPRKKIILGSVSPSSWTGDVKLTRNNTKVKVFDASSGGTEITFNGTDNKFGDTNLPKPLWVQGDSGSGSMRDVELKLETQSPAPSCSDKVKFTVLWVTVSTDHSGSLETDNSARNAYSNFVVPPPDYTLGHHLFCTYHSGFSPQTGWNGRGSEFLGAVEPSDLVPSDFSTDPEVLHLAREIVDGNEFWGANGNENSSGASSGGDTSNATYRDDDPQGGGSGGTVYDFDLPGICAVWGPPTNTIHRFRLNFREWADWDGTRCSEKKEWYTRQSYKKTGSADSGTASSGTASTLADTSKSWSANGWAPGVVKIQSGTGAGQVRRITSNTSTTITVTNNWSVTPDNTSVYEIINTSTWTLVNDVSNDNKNADGTTNITWDLN